MTRKFKPRFKGDTPERQAFDEEVLRKKIEHWLDKVVPQINSAWRKLK